MRGPCIRRLFGFDNLLNNRIARRCDSLICEYLVSPGYSGLKIIQLIVWLIDALLHYSLIYEHLISLGYLGSKIIQIIVLRIVALLHYSLMCVDLVSPGN